MTAPCARSWCRNASSHVLHRRACDRRRRGSDNPGPCWSLQHGQAWHDDLGRRHSPRHAPSTARAPRRRASTSGIGGTTTPSASIARRTLRRLIRTPLTVTSQGTAITVKATRNAARDSGSSPPTRSRTMPIASTVTTVVEKPPTLTRPVDVPSRSAGLNVRAKSKPMADAGPLMPSTTTSTTSSHSGLRPGCSRTAAQAIAVATAIVSTIHERRSGCRPVSTPMAGPETTVAATLTLIRTPACVALRPCAEVRKGNPHRSMKTIAGNPPVACVQNPSQVPGVRAAARTLCCTPAGPRTGTTPGGWSRTAPPAPGAAVRDHPPGVVPVRGPAGVQHKVRAAARTPGTWLGFWTHATGGFPAMVFMLLWGFPFLTSAQGLSATQAGVLMSVSVAATVVSGPAIGVLTGRHPLRRSWMVLTIAVATAMAWAAVLLHPGRSPLWLLVVLVVVLGISGPASAIGFDFARTFNPADRLGTSTGLVNVGGFSTTVVTVLAIGIVLDLVGGDDPLSLAAFRVAFTVMAVPWLVTVSGVLISRRSVRRAMLAEGVVVPPIPEVLARRRGARAVDGA